MSIAIHIRYEGAKGAARAFVEEMMSSSTVAAIRAEEGNLGYNYFIPFDDPEAILLVDKWENQDALDSHHASPMMKTIAELREKYDLHMSVERFVSESLPESDDMFVRE